MNHDQLERRVRLLTRYVVGLSLALIVVVLGAAGPAATAWFDQIHARTVEADTVRAAVVVAEQLRVVEPDGSLALLASNTRRMPGFIMDGDTMNSRGGRSGLIFFYEGKETGGLTFRDALVNGEPSGYRGLSFDQIDHDRTVLISQQSSPNGTRAGITLRDWSREFDLLDYRAFMDSTETLPPSERDAARAALNERAGRGEFGGERAALLSDNRTAVLRLGDYRGRTRLRATVDSLGSARIEFLNGEGEVVRTITADE